MCPDATRPFTPYVPLGRESSPSSILAASRRRPTGVSVTRVVSIPPFEVKELITGTSRYFKTTNFGPEDKLGLQFRTEFFNTFNRVQFGPPNTACCKANNLASEL